MSTYEAPRTAQRMLVIAMGLIDTLTPDQRAGVMLALDDPRRLDWDIIPRPDATGVALHAFDRHQRVLVMDLLRAALPLRTFTKILAIRELEHVLRDYERDFLGPALQTWRTSDSYRLTLFGRPGFEDTWGLRFLGHHVCVNLTVVGERRIASTPFALGQQPVDYEGVLRPLADDEGLGFALLDALDPGQRETAVIHPVAPADFVTRQVPVVGAFEYPDYYDLGMPQYTITSEDRRALRLDRDEPVGVRAGALRAGQRAILDRLATEFALRGPEETVAERAEALRGGPDGDAWFAWAGATRRGAPHYFRLHTRTHLAEVVNAVDEGRHLHTVVRDLRGDFGLDLIARHGHDRDRLRTRVVSSADLDPGLDERS